MAQQILEVGKNGADSRRVLEMVTPVNGDGAPAVNAVFLGQLYVDETNDDAYISIQTGTGATDWKQITA